MKFTLIGLLFLSMISSAFALNRAEIKGKEAIELHKALTINLGLKVDRHGSSPESGCYNNTTTTLMGMVCYAGNCYDDDSNSVGQVFMVTCVFDGVKDKADLAKIQTILKATGLRSTHSIFKN